MGLVLKDVVRFLELTKNRAELSFRQEISKNEEAEELGSRLKSVQNELSRLSEKIEKAGVQIAVPNECEIARLNESLSKCTAQDIHEAMKKRDGEVFETLASRGKLIKQNFENRENIAKLALLCAKLEKEVKEAVLQSVKRGSVGDSIPLLNTNPEISKKIAAILGRLGMHATVREGSLTSSEKGDEIEVQLHSRKVWVSTHVVEKLNANLEQMKSISSKIQLKNAVRQIKDFSEEEEKEFASMQGEYLKLLKEQDLLIKDFLDEEKITVTVT